MKKLVVLFTVIGAMQLCHAQSPVGKWKVVSHTIIFEGKKMDIHAALVSQRPCAANVVYEINADATYRLNAANSGCDEKYINIQQRLYGKTKWKLESNKFTSSAINFAVGQSYTISISGSKMTWIGTDGQGTIVYQKL